MCATRIVPITLPVTGPARITMTPEMKPIGLLKAMVRPLGHAPHFTPAKNERYSYYFLMI